MPVELQGRPVSTNTLFRQIQQVRACVRVCLPVNAIVSLPLPPCPPVARSCPLMPPHVPLWLMPSRCAASQTHVLSWLLQEVAISCIAQLLSRWLPWRQLSCASMGGEEDTMSFPQLLMAKTMIASANISC